jgi:hypothetical protein
VNESPMRLRPLELNGQSSDLLRRQDGDRPFGQSLYQSAGAGAFLGQPENTSVPGYPVYTTPVNDFSLVMDLDVSSVE